MSAIDLQRQIDQLRRAVDALTALQDVGASGTYTPTLNNTTNISSSTAELSTYYRVGNAMTVMGRLEATATGAGACVLRVPLPIASAIGELREVVGTGAANGVVVEIRGNAANDAADLAWVAPGAGAVAIYYHFTARII